MQSHGEFASWASCSTLCARKVRFLRISIPAVTFRPAVRCLVQFGTIPISLRSALSFGPNPACRHEARHNGQISSISMPRSELEMPRIGLIRRVRRAAQAGSSEITESSGALLHARLPASTWPCSRCGPEPTFSRLRYRLSFRRLALHHMPSLDSDNPPGGHLVCKSISASATFLVPRACIGQPQLWSR